jgi:membrane-associated phospholipid phosphatase
MVLVWTLAELVPAIHIRDAAALRDFTLLSRPHVDALASFLLNLLDPLLFAVWSVSLVAVAFARSRPRVALAVAPVLTLAPLTSEQLKPLLGHANDRVQGVHIGVASWPSGHSAAALALALCAVLVAPPRRRALVAALGGLYAVAVGGALLILAWHMPSDVLGGYLVAILWTALAVAALRAAERRWPSQRFPASGSSDFGSAAAGG